MTQIQITETERTILQRYTKTSPLLLIRAKSTSIQLASDGVSNSIISNLFDRAESTIEGWISNWNSLRLGSIFTGHKDNQNAALLTREQKKEIKLALEKPPSEYNLSSEFWDIPRLKEYTQATFGTIYESNQSYYFLLKFCNYTFKYPDTQNPKRGTDQEIETRIQEIREEIHQIKLNSPDTLIFTADETRLQHQSEIRKAWLKKGEKTIVKTQRSDKHQNYFGFLNNDTGECKIFEIEQGNSLETIRVLQELKSQYPNQKICIIWDNAAWHKSALLKTELSKNGSLSDIHLINLPPYAPDTNPIEHVWQWSKGKISNRSTTEWDELKVEFESWVNSRKFDYKI